MSRVSCKLWERLVPIDTSVRSFLLLHHQLFSLLYGYVKIQKERSLKARKSVKERKRSKIHTIWSSKFLPVNFRLGFQFSSSQLSKNILHKPIRLTWVTRTGLQDAGGFWGHSGPFWGHLAFIFSLKFPLCDYRMSLHIGNDPVVSPLQVTNFHLNLLSTQCKFYNFSRAFCIIWKLQAEYPRHFLSSTCF